MSIKKATSLLLLFTFIILIIAIVGCSPNKSYLVDITLSNLVKKINAKESFILLISNKDCPHCKILEPKLISVINKEKVTVYKIDTFYLKNAGESNQLKDYTSYNGTPTVEFFINGEESSTLNRIVGSEVSENDIKQKLIDNNYIKQ